MSVTPQTVQARVCAGVDWAKDDHAIAIIDPDGQVLDRFAVTHDAGLKSLVRRLLTAGVDEVGIERGDGPLVKQEECRDAPKIDRTRLATLTRISACCESLLIWGCIGPGSSSRRSSTSFLLCPLPRGYRWPHQRRYPSGSPGATEGRPSGDIDVGCRERGPKALTA